MKLIDLTGQEFGRLVAIQRVENDKRGQSRWLCKCDCGTKKIILGKSLKSGHTKSCGCLVIKHGHNKNGKSTKFYKSWYSMKDRCTNPNHKYYKDYGGRGITICKRWMKFENFLEDMPGWKPDLTLERDNNELGYFKDNCYWGTRTEQARNRRDNLYVSYNGKKRLLVELCEEHNMSYRLVYERIYKLGWSPERVLTEPVRKK